MWNKLRFLLCILFTDIHTVCPARTITKMRCRATQEDLNKPSAVEMLQKKKGQRDQEKRAEEENRFIDRQQCCNEKTIW